LNAVEAEAEAAIEAAVKATTAGVKARHQLQDNVSSQLDLQPAHSFVTRSAQLEDKLMYLLQMQRLC